MSLEDVEQAIRRVRDHLRLHRRYPPGGVENRSAPVRNSEMSTRYLVIDPVLRSLGWDLSDPDHCVVEHISGDKRGRRHHFRYPRVDYALLYPKGRPAVLVEAKVVSLSVRVRADGEQARKWNEGRSQLREYLEWSGNRGVKVGCLTNGQEWDFYQHDGRRWVWDRKTVTLGSRAVRRNARRLIELMGREQYWQVPAPGP